MILYVYNKDGERTYMVLRPRINMTGILILSFICIFETIYAGTIQKVQSHMQDIADHTYKEVIKTVGL